MHKVRSILGTVRLGAALLTLLAITASAQEKGASRLLRPLPPTTCVEKEHKQHPKLFSSYVAPLGTIGTTGRYQIIVVKVRGLDTPNVAGFLIYDSANDEIVGAQTGVAPGLGTALVNGGSQVAGSYLFGSRLRPATESTSVNNDSASSAGASSTATGNGGNGGTGGNGGGGFTPPGHINNPGHGHNPHNP